MQRHLLVAYASDLMAELLQEFFSRRGYRVDTAHDGLESLALLRQTNPDVLILDANLRWGGADGILDWLYHEKQGPPTPVILLTD